MRDALSRTEFTIELTEEYFNRLRRHALAGSIARDALSKAKHARINFPAVWTIVCDRPAAEALHQLAAICCVHALEIIEAALKSRH